MGRSNDYGGPSAERRHEFATTRWSVVLAAGNRHSPLSKQALATLCQAYWYPAYVYVRRRGSSVVEAEDLTQEFFVRVLEKNYIGEANRERGKFRSFLLTALKHFLSKERDRANAQKRGGGALPLSLDFESAQGRYKLEPAHGLTAEQVFERRWALTLLENALTALRDWCERQGKLKRFDRLKVCLEGRGPESYRDIATELGMTEEAVKQEVVRLRKRCRESLRNQIAETVSTPEEVDEEIRRLFEAISL